LLALLRKFVACFAARHARSEAKNKARQAMSFCSPSAFCYAAALRSAFGDKTKEGRQSSMLASHFLLRAPEAIKSLWLAAFGRHASKLEV
jgi:hypothetical protein